MLTIATALPHLLAALGLGLAASSLWHDARRLRAMLAHGMIEELPAHAG